ncbi:leucine-rich repeat-containing protein 24 [Cimex lectularius]|uniref:Ig-like domain-containing protein n=1 Tax=Cimex lectularius TaxID=79782 RepID=A0A8I6S955_CIMLE|nr:leucine-rich repeat-containing protein 24 [Cimex lectularius]
MLVVLLLLLGMVHVWACPSSCICKWKGGKQTVECINKSLITLPSGMDHGTQVLDFAGNNLDRLLRERFQRMGLINLQKIFLSRCRIKHIEDRAFKGLTNLVELDLSDNSITSVPTETFYDYPSLMRLTLNGNPIKVLKTNAFQPLSFLTNLELSKCEMETIEDGAFDGLNMLEWLKLDNNNVKYISGKNILPRNLHGIDLHHNPWQCDCNLISLTQWLVKFSVPQSIEPACQTPERLKGKQIKTLSTNQLACLPDMKHVTPLILEISEGQNVSLLCQVSAIPEAKISWWYEGNVLQNDSTVAPGLHLYYFVEEGTVEKTSELFIFNTNVDDNGTFVCIAENSAGRSHSNYTIRIILKEEPVIGLAVFPYEYFVVISAAVSVIALLGVICVTLCLIQCKRQKRRKRKKDRSKVAALPNQPISDKTPVVRDNDTITRIGSIVQAPKINGTAHGQEMMAFASGPGVLVIPNNLKYTTAPMPQNYQEQNPDLINDTGSKEWKGPKEEQDIEKGWVAGTLPRRDVFPKHMTADVHLSPGKFIDQDGYPVDYGLPKMPGPFPVVMPSSSFYRTLPHKPRHAPAAKFSREAEFVTKPGSTASFEHFNPSDVRYTLEGYPCVQPLYPAFQDPFISPPAGYKSDPKDAAAQWPESNLDTLRTQSVGAQTFECEQGSNAILEEPQALTESPDEGYEGDVTEPAEN